MQDNNCDRPRPQYVLSSWVSVSSPPPPPQYTHTLKFETKPKLETKPVVFIPTETQLRVQFRGGVGGRGGGFKPDDNQEKGHHDSVIDIFHKKAYSYSVKRGANLTAVSLSLSGFGRIVSVFDTTDFCFQVKSKATSFMARNGIPRLRPSKQNCRLLQDPVCRKWHARTSEKLRSIKKLPPPPQKKKKKTKKKLTQQQDKIGGYFFGQALLLYIV